MGIQSSGGLLMRAEQSWSLIDPRPVLLYLDHHDDYLVYWNGIVMPHIFAVHMVAELYGIYPTPEMKKARLTTYKKLYYSNAFNTRAWDSKVNGGSDVFSYLKHLLSAHIAKQCEGKSLSEVLGWFDYKKARIEVTQTKDES